MSREEVARGKDILSAISDEMHVKPGLKENKLFWQGRLVYSLCGRQALACLFDREEGVFSCEELKAQCVLRGYFENRIREVFTACLRLYPSLKDLFGEKREEEVREFLVREIYDVYKRAGFFYVAGDYLYPVEERGAQVGKLFLIRGSGFLHSLSMSGLGLYTLHVLKAWPPLDTEAFLGLPSEKPDAYYVSCLRRGNWRRGSDYGPLEEFEAYLSGDWAEATSSLEAGQVLVVRRKEKESGEKSEEGNKEKEEEREKKEQREKKEERERKEEEKYFLAKQGRGEVLFSPLPAFLQQGEEIKRLLTGYLMWAKTLPAITYDFDKGVAVMIIPEGLLPPPERELIRLYTWPGLLKSSIEGEARYASGLVFDMLRDLLLERGYAFTRARGAIWEENEEGKRKEYKRRK